MSSYLPPSDAQLAQWGQNYKDVAFANQAALNLSPAQFAEIEDAANDFSDALSASDLSKQTTAGLVAAKEEQKATSVEVLRRYSQMILNDPTVTTALKGQLGLTVTPTPFGPVTAPTDVSATPYANGQVSIRWNRNGNAYTTIFTVEAKRGPSGDWQVVGTTGKARITVDGFDPGDMATFRVFSTRGSTISGHSMEVVIYSQSEAEIIPLSEAA